jgi:type I restriction enzyme S subunit
MQEEKQLVPQLRFSEFEEEWVEKRLEKLFSEFKSGQNITSSHIKESGEYPVFGGNGLRGYINEYTHDGNYFLIGRQGALCGNINKFKGKAYFSEHAIACRANETNDTNWLSHRLEYFSLNRLSESSAQPGLSVGKLLRFKLIIPLKEEQQKIANFLTVIDNRIQTLEKKETLLEQYKKGVMQKIFKQELRFKDDTSTTLSASDGKAFPEWEEKKLGDFLSLAKKETPEFIDISKILTVKLNLKGVFLNNRTDGLKIGATKYIIRKKGQFIYGKQNLFNGAFAIIPDKFDGFVSSGDVPSLDIDSNQLDSKFLYFFLARTSFYKKLENIASGSGSKRIHEKTLFKVEIDLPSLKEQTKIADFLSAIDENIALVTKKIEHTKTYKKGLLQQMFV